MNVKIEYIVLATQAWSFTDEATKEIKEGVSIHYLDSASKHDEKEKKGTKLIKTIGDIKLFNKFVELPGIYEFQLGIESVSIGKAQKVVLNDIEFIKPVDFNDLFEDMEKRVNNTLEEVTKLLPEVLEGKIEKNQIPNVINSLKSKVSVTAAREGMKQAAPVKS